MVQKSRVLLKIYLVITVLGLASFFFSPPVWAHESNSALNNALYKSTAILASRHRTTFQHGCTATIFEKDERAQRLMTAAHCVADDHKDEVKIRSRNMYVHFDNGPIEKYVPAKVLAAGYQRKKHDCAILEVANKDLEGYSPPIIPLAKGQVELGEQVINVANPYELDKRLYLGSVSSPKINWPFIDTRQNINWEGAMFLQTPVGFGSSGSVVVSIRQKAIVAILVGFSYGDTVAIPIQWCQDFWAQVKAGKYQWFKLEETQKNE